MRRVVILYSPLSRPNQEELWQTNQRSVKTRLAAALPRKAASIAAPLAKEPETPFN